MVVGERWCVSPFVACQGAQAFDGGCSSEGVASNHLAGRSMCVHDFEAGHRVPRPSLLILDEAFDGLDKNSRIELASMLESFFDDSPRALVTLLQTTLALRNSFDRTGKRMGKSFLFEPLLIFMSLSFSFYLHFHSFSFHHYTILSFCR